ncbi:hypothetical protein HHK36_008784 [Tetracentron sinense]|uniref:NmrA-like domain-containing protein n=1 Tax=Tetracentron sinense TaxID=13715 RepID=A0A835DKB2_TETSI|nr:hypothetical protein HHK36_008784 [Tetracentron sinense]
MASRCTALPTQLATARNHKSQSKPSTRNAWLSWRRTLAQDDLVSAGSSVLLASSSSQGMKFSSECHLFQSLLTSYHHRLLGLGHRNKQSTSAFHLGNILVKASRRHLGNRGFLSPVLIKLDQSLVIFNHWGHYHLLNGSSLHVHHMPSLFTSNGLHLFGSVRECCPSEGICPPKVCIASTYTIGSSRGYFSLEICKWRVTTKGTLSAQRPPEEDHRHLLHNKNSTPRLGASLDVRRNEKQATNAAAIFVSPFAWLVMTLKTFLARFQESMLSMADSFKDSPFWSRGGMMGPIQMVHLIVSFWIGHMYSLPVQFSPLSYQSNLILKLDILQSSHGQTFEIIQLWARTLEDLDDRNQSADRTDCSPTLGSSYMPSVVTCTQAAVATNLSPGTPVRPTSILVVGATGTLGRQVVRRALDEGYDVRCLVRPRPAPADFLRDWGATVVNVADSYPIKLWLLQQTKNLFKIFSLEGLTNAVCVSKLGITRRILEQADLSKPETIPATLVGIHTVIDCATGRPEEPIKTVDWEGKVALIQCAKAMGIQKYVFFSIHNCDKHPEVPLMEIKYCTEKFLQDSGLTYITIRLCGFMQGLIGQYAVPILEEKSVWGTDAPTRIAYMDTQDIARLTFIALRNEKTERKLLTFAGPRAWTTQEVITLCERLAGQDANVTTVPVSVLKFTRQLTRLFEWTNDVADRLAFSEVLTSDTVFSVPMNETYNLLGVDQKDIISLEKYLQDYFTNILKKLKDLKAQSKQSDFYI